MPIPAAILLLLLASGSSAHGQEKPNPARQELDQYEALVSGFRRGDGGVVPELIVWPQKNVLAVVAAVQAHHGVRWTAPQVKAAVMMHTSAAIYLLDKVGRNDDAIFHLHAASSLLNNPDEELRRFAGAWHVAVARLAMDRMRIEAIDTLLESARKHVPDDPGVLYMSGLFAEFLAGPLSFEALPPVPGGGRSMRLDMTFDRIWRRRDTNLMDAARWLRDALTRDPHNSLARLHLARVEMLREQDAQALRLFEEVRASAGGDTQLLYLAAMFEGAVHERAGRLDQAIPLYREAIAALPASHAAYIALSEALQRAGRGDESRQVLQTLLRTARAMRLEPWWTYFFEDSKVTNARLNALLAEVRP